MKFDILIYICIFMFIVVLFAFTPSCLWEGALFRLFVYVCACWCPTHIVLCFCFALFVMCALCCQLRWIFLLFFGIATSVFSNIYSNMTSFFRFVNKRDLSIGYISLAHAPVHVTDFPVVNVHVDELSSARIWHHTLCAKLSASVNINYRLPIKVYYRICTLMHIRIEIIHGSQNEF
jgi:hypothetical protein